MSQIRLSLALLFEQKFAKWRQNSKNKCSANFQSDVIFYVPRLRKAEQISSDPIKTLLQSSFTSFLGFIFFPLYSEAYLLHGLKKEIGKINLPINLMVCIICLANFHKTRISTYAKINSNIMVFLCSPFMSKLLRAICFNTSNYRCINGN